MSVEEPQVVATGRYNIGQTCLLLGISRNTLFKYTLNGTIKCGYRPNLRKFYTGLEILRFWRMQI